MNSTYVSLGNSRLEKTKDVQFIIFSLPRIVTCPEATDSCKESCYAKKAHSYPGVVPKREKCYHLSREEYFVDTIVEEINNEIKMNKMNYIRIHEEGDFYDEEYLGKWVCITNKYKNNDKIKFVAYTKSIHILNTYCKENNISINQINIKFLFSQMPDTDSESIMLANSHEMNKYIVLNETDSIPDGKELCEMNCPTCLSCYRDDIDNYTMIRP